MAINNPFKEWDWERTRNNFIKLLAVIALIVCLFYFTPLGGFISKKFDGKKPKDTVATVSNTHPKKVVRDEPIGKIIGDAFRESIVPAADSAFVPLGEEKDTVVSVREILSQIGNLRKDMDTVKADTKEIKKDVKQIKKQKRSRYRKSTYNLGW